MTHPAAAPAPAQNPLAAALWMTGSIASFSGMAIAVRELKGAHDTFEIMAVRSLVGLVIVVALAAAFGRQTATLAGNPFTSCLEVTCPRTPCSSPILPMRDAMLQRCTQLWHLSSAPHQAEQDHRAPQHSIQQLLARGHVCEQLPEHW